MIEIGGRKSFRDYEAFKEYLHIMHIKALELMENLSENDQRYLNNFFRRFYETTKEHYWSLKKLFSMAMYIPMFLLIGISWKDKSVFDGLVYIDTHSGAGLAKIGTDERDVVLGSPLLAVLWPDIIATKLKTFRKIQRGFDRLFFIERDLKTYGVLKRLAEYTERQNICVLLGDSNNLLSQVKSEIESEFRRPLILLFIDPFGEFSTQIRLPVLRSFVDGWPVDLIMNVMSPSLARGFSSIAKNVEQFRGRVRELLGDLCEYEEAWGLQIFDLLPALKCGES